MARRAVLYQFPISHYCEKARFCLDVKGVDYEVRNLFPGFHKLTLRKLGGDTVPLLVDGDAVLRDSGDIVLHLERAYPEPRLVPADEAEAADARALMAYFDEVVGPAVRRWAYGHVLDTPGALEEIFFEGYGAVARAAGRVVAPGMKKGLRRFYRIGDGSEAESRAVLGEALDRLDARLGGDAARPLVGSTLSFADVTGAAILSALVAPPGSPYTMRERTPRALHAMRDEICARPAGRWVQWVYASARAAEPRRP